MSRSFDVATEGLHQQPSGPPLIGFLRPLVDWWEDRHLELMAGRGFGDVRRAHNAVFVNLPEGGRRLTDLAADAHMSKQAMAELVDDLVGKGYLAKVPDPSDGRAKLIVWDERGEAAHEATLEAFAQLEADVADILGATRAREVRNGLAELLRATDSG